MIYWNLWGIWLLRCSGIALLSLIGIVLVYIFGVEETIAFLIAFVGFVIYVTLVVWKVEKEKKILIKKYVETGDKEYLEKAFPTVKLSKKK